MGNVGGIQPEFLLIPEFMPFTRHMNECWLCIGFLDCESFLYMACLLVSETENEKPSLPYSTKKLWEGRE